MNLKFDIYIFLDQILYIFFKISQQVYMFIKLKNKEVKGYVKKLIAILNSSYANNLKATPQILVICNFTLVLTVNFFYNYIIYIYKMILL